MKIEDLTPDQLVTLDNFCDPATRDYGKWAALLRELNPNTSQEAIDEEIRWIKFCTEYEKKEKDEKAMA